MTYDVIIVGAGLAGCSTATQLAAQGVQVLLLEQAQYPTHRLCGEFLSVEVIAAFDALGVLDRVREAGAHPIQQAFLTTTSGASFYSTLPGTALGLSRYRLDQILFERSRAVGAICQDGTSVKSVVGHFHEGFTVSTSQGEFKSRMVIGAFGKRSNLDRSLKRDFVERRSPWVACKAHYRGRDLPQGIELHAFPGGYCGLSQIEAGQINVCWIAHERILQSVTKTGDRITPDALFKNPVLAQWLEGLKRVSASQSLAQISFALKDKFEGNLLMVGDSGGMITPLCGDGMAMALRSAELAVPLVMDLLQGSLSHADFQHLYRIAWNHEFKLRLQLGRWMHHLFIQPPLASVGVNLCSLFPPLGDWIIRSTRGTSVMVAPPATVQCHL